MLIYPCIKTALQSKMMTIGKPMAGSIPTGCKDIQTLGWTLSGFYTVKGSTNKVSTVFCDFTKASGVKGLLMQCVNSLNNIFYNNPHNDSNFNCSCLLVSFIV